MSFNVENIRSQFPALEQIVNGNALIYFDSAATSLKPKGVIDAVSEYYSTINSNVHRGSHYLSSKSTEAYEEARSKVGNFINANPKEIIFTSGTTDSINLIVNSLEHNYLKKGDEVILSITEHHSNIVPWVELKKRLGIDIKVLGIDEYGDFDYKLLEELITDKTRVISVCHTSNVLGIRNDAKRIVEIAKNKSIITILDGAQTIAHERIDVKDIGCDFYVFSAHKMYGPMGLGVIYANENMFDLITPFRYGGGIIRNVDFKNIDYINMPHKMEAGTPYVSGVVGLGAAIDFISSIDFKKIIAHETELIIYLGKRLRDIEGINIYGSEKRRESLISFNVEGIHHSDLAMLLDNFGIAIRNGQHCAQPLMRFLEIDGALRVSLSMVNTKSEIDFLIDKLNISIKMLS